MWVHKIRSGIYLYVCSFQSYRCAAPWLFFGKLFLSDVQQIWPFLSCVTIYNSIQGNFIVYLEPRLLVIFSFWHNSCMKRYFGFHSWEQLLGVCFLQLSFKQLLIAVLTSYIFMCNFYLRSHLTPSVCPSVHPQHVIH